MPNAVSPLQIILGIVLVLSSIGVIAAKKPVHSCLAFLLTLLTLGAYYLQLAAPFIAVMQILVYAGGILVIFMFVIVLFQDAHLQIAHYESKTPPLFLIISAALFVLTILSLANQFIGILPISQQLPADYGTIHALGRALYLDFFFPFEAIILLFLVAIVGSLYIGKKVK